MAFRTDQATEGCLICGADANIRYEARGHTVRCSRCGDFWIDAVWSMRWQRAKDAKKVALASHLIRKIQASAGLAEIGEEFFRTLDGSALPTPAEAMNTLLLWCSELADKRPGAQITINCSAPATSSELGVVDASDVEWVVQSLISKNLLHGEVVHRSNVVGERQFSGYLTADGWGLVEDLLRARVSSKYAFFARKFDNSELDEVYVRCLRDAVKSTGYDLRTVTQKAGTVDAIIEDEIRRCRFLIADLTDGNNGAYWEAGFAEGLGKPVIYICRDVKKETGEPIETHFDTDHRHTVRWNLNSLDAAAKQLKAVIRNTLLGDANQSDE